MKAVIIGAGGQGKVVAEMMDLLRDKLDCTIEGFVDSGVPKGTRVFGYEVVGDEAEIGRLGVDSGVVAIGDNAIRAAVVSRIRHTYPSFRFLTLVHPSAVIGKGVQLGEGSVVMAAAVLNSDSVVGKHCVINTASVVEHDCVIEDFSFISPSATLGGGVHVGRLSFVGMGSSVMQLRRIGDEVVVGANSLVYDSLPDHCVAYGAPARVVRQRAHGDKYLSSPRHEVIR